VMSGLRNSVKSHGKWIIGIIAYLIFAFLWNVYEMKKENYTDLHRRVQVLESYHK